MTSHERKRNRERVAKAYRDRKAEGWINTMIWLPGSADETVRARAKQFGLTKHAVLTAALVAGLRAVTASEIQRLDMQWHQTVKTKQAVLFQKGHPFMPRLTPRPQSSPHQEITP